MSQHFSNSDRILQHNQASIPGGMSSLNRLITPNIAFASGRGSKLLDADGNEYIDYHGAFGPQLLGYRHAGVLERVRRTLDAGVDLFGAGPTEAEGKLADLICARIPWAEQVAFLNSGSEATAQAIRLARAHTGRDHVILMEGGYNGWHNDVACNLMTPLDKLGPRRSPGEYPVHAISAGIPSEVTSLLHPVNFNDLDSVRYVCERTPVAAVITEPILQNIGVVKPQPGYLEGLRSLADEYGFVLIFDEIKTGFRHAFGGYAEVSGVRPDLVVYGKALSSGYPLSALGGSRRLMENVSTSDPNRRVILAGTSNAHPVPVAAAVATLEALLEDDGAIYRRLEKLGEKMEAGLAAAFADEGVAATIVRQGSAFVIYFMDHAPQDWHDLAGHHDFDFDLGFRRRLVEDAVFFLPIATKQCSLSAAHSEEDVDRTLKAVRKALRSPVRAV